MPTISRSFWTQQICPAELARRSRSEFPEIHKVNAGAAVGRNGKGIPPSAVRAGLGHPPQKKAPGPLREKRRERALGYKMDKTRHAQQ